MGCWCCITAWLKILPLCWGDSLAAGPRQVSRCGTGEAGSVLYSVSPDWSTAFMGAVVLYQERQRSPKRSGASSHNSEITRASGHSLTEGSCKFR